MLIGELFKQADLYIVKTLHLRILAQRFQLGKKEALQVLDKLKISIKADRETLIKIARTCLRRKLSIENDDILTDRYSLLNKKKIAKELTWYRTPLKSRHLNDQKNVIYPVVCGLT